jgi:hypothetical protein
LVKFSKCAAGWSLVLTLLPGLVLAQPADSPAASQLRDPPGKPIAFLAQPPGSISQPAVNQSQPAAHQGQPAKYQGQPAVYQSQPVTYQAQPQTLKTAENDQASPDPIIGQPPADSSIKAAFALLDSLFRRPQFLYVAVGPDIPADMQPILARLNNAIAANQAWFQQHRSDYPNQPLPYDEHFGITAEEYRRVLRLQLSPPPLVPIDSQTVAVVKEGSLIHLQCNGSGEEHLLNYLYIDPASRVLEYGGDTIPFAGPVSSGPNSPYGQWAGYAWHLERIQALAPPVDPLQPVDPQRTDPQKAPDPKLISARIVEVNIGIPADGSPKTFIRIQYQNVQAGVATGNLELLGYIE